MLLYLKTNNYDAAKACINSSTAACKENVKAIDFCMKNGFGTLRVQQERTSLQIMDDFLTVAASGQNYIDVLNAMCMGIVLLCSLIISGIMIIVIKGKSGVMAIFAEITEDEIRIVLEHAQSLAISAVRFKSQYVADALGDDEKYWQLVLQDHNISSMEARRHTPLHTDGAAASQKTRKQEADNRGGFSERVKKIILHKTGRAYQKDDRPKEPGEPLDIFRIHLKATPSGKNDSPDQAKDDARNVEEDSKDNSVNPVSRHSVGAEGTAHTGNGSEKGAGRVPQQN